MQPVQIAFVGCGYVADYYARTLENHSHLRLAGSYDSDARNLERFAGRWKGRSYDSLAQLLADPSIELVLNLTNPRNHLEVTRACLEAGKHVYSEKPLAMTPVEAHGLAELARSRGLQLSSAPCSLLGSAAQTMWKAIREGAVGKVRLVYANFDDGMIAPRMQPWNWTNDRGVPWPAKDEFEVGCTYEHAGYVLTWLAAFFGPATRVNSFAATLIPEKGVAVGRMAPDFTAGSIEYPGNVVARVTCGLVAPRDKSITVVGDDGILFVGNVRDDSAPVILRPAALDPWKASVARRFAGLDRWLEKRFAWPGAVVLFQRRYPPVARGAGSVAASTKRVDFMLGPADLARAVRENRAPRLSAEMGVHVVEIVEALQFPERFAHNRVLTTTFPAPAPMPEA